MATSAGAPVTQISNHPGFHVATDPAWSKNDVPSPSQKVNVFTLLAGKKNKDLGCQEVAQVAFGILCDPVPRVSIIKRTCNGSENGLETALMQRHSVVSER